MARNEKRDAYRTLTRVTVTLLVLAVVFATGYVMLDKLSKATLDKRAQEVQQQNEALLSERAQAEAEMKKEEAASSQTGSAEWPTPAQTGWDVVDLSEFEVKGGTTITATRQDMLLSGLVLVNRWHGLPADWDETTLVSIGNATKYNVPVANSSLKMFPAAVNALNDMVTAAKTEAELDGFIIREAHRTMDTQNKYFEDKKTALSNKYAGDALEAEAAKTVAKPGYSDYQTGFSFQLDAYKKGDTALNALAFVDTDQSKWVYANSWRFGIVLRFPIQGYPYAATEDKSYTTGISGKMDTYRYVGVEHAAVMHVKNFCLEEYVQYLIDHPHIAVYEDGALKYEIFRQEGCTGTVTLNVPANAASYTVTTDNMNGTICAITY